jgi:hypothetical protein
MPSQHRKRPRCLRPGASCIFALVTVITACHRNGSYGDLTPAHRRCGAQRLDVLRKPSLQVSHKPPRTSRKQSPTELRLRGTVTGQSLCTTSYSEPIGRARTVTGKLEQIWRIEWAQSAEPRAPKRALLHLRTFLIESALRERATIIVVGGNVAAEDAANPQRGNCLSEEPVN